MKVWRGKTLAEKHQEKQNKRRNQDKEPKPMTAAQLRKVEQLRAKLAESNRQMMKQILPQGAEIR